MHRFAPLVLLLSACGESQDARSPDSRQATNNGAASAARVAPSSPQPKVAAAARWDLQSRGEGTALALLSASGAAAIRLFCPAGGKTLVVNVPGFRAIGSEERLSVGSGGVVSALVADTRGDRLRGGVSGSGAVPGDLARLIAGSMSASYGAQASGPHSPVPPDLARAFVSACNANAVPASPEREAGVGPCNTQDGRRLAVQPLRVIGTEPFWAARIDGRCVTYLHPEDQKGTRIWTRHTPAGVGGSTWSGVYAAKPFELRIRPQDGCSDGMSDRRYPLIAELLIGGEHRQGCAAPS